MNIEIRADCKVCGGDITCNRYRTYCSAECRNKHNNKKYKARQAQWQKELEQKKIEAIVSGHFEGFTASEVIGYWKGSKERTLKIEVITDLAPGQLAKIGKELKTKLEQESVLMEIIKSNCAFL